MVESPLKPVLQPFSVPWMISPSISDLHLWCRENADAVVQFSAFLGHHAPKASQRIIVVFADTLYSKMAPGHSNQASIDEAAYDWSMVGANFATIEEFQEDLKRFDRDWESTRLCPDPNAYEVLHSPWSKEYKNKFRHFLLAGHDSFIEILAKSWEWEIAS